MDNKEIKTKIRHFQMVPSGKKQIKADDMVLTSVGYLHRVVM